VGVGGNESTGVGRLAGSVVESDGGRTTGPVLMTTDGWLEILGATLGIVLGWYEKLGNAVGEAVLPRFGGARRMG
jgi:hypothetical protein